MSKQPTLYHNPRCSKSRQTLELLQERGYHPKIVEYLKTPPTKSEITSLLDQLGMDAHDIVRSKETAYTEAALSPQSKTSEVVSAIVDYPILLERPIVCFDNKAAIGRPPENVLNIL